MAHTESSKSALLHKGPLAKIQSASTQTESTFTNICTGMGVDHEIPLRIAVYALPTLQLGEQYLSAQTEFYVAQAFAIKLNDLDPHELAANTTLIQEYVNLLRIQLDITKVPVWLDEDDPFVSERVNTVQRFAQALREQGSERLMRFADSRNGDASLEYIAAHALYMWDDLGIDDDIFITKRDHAPESLLMVGGPAEKLFYEARQILVTTFPNPQERSTTQAYTEIGRRPPYYRVGDEMILDKKNQHNLSLEALLAIGDSDVLRDTLYLIISLTETLTFADLGRIKKGPVNETEKDDIREACVKLQAIVDQLLS